MITNYEGYYKVAKATRLYEEIKSKQKELQELKECIVSLLETHCDHEGWEDLDVLDTDFNPADIDALIQHSILLKSYTVAGSDMETAAKARVNHINGKLKKRAAKPVEAPLMGDRPTPSRPKPTKPA